MNRDAIGAVAELAGAAGVIFSLVYLGRQIRQSNATHQLTATLSLRSSYNDVGDLFLRDGDVVSKGLLDFESLEAASQLKFLVIFHLFFGHAELIQSHARKGMLGADLLNRTYTSLYAYYRLPGVKQWWSQMGRRQFSPEFVAFVEDPNEAGLGQAPMVPAEENWGRTSQAAL